MTNDEIRALALSHGFTLRPQPDGLMDLNPYVYAFARELCGATKERCAKAAWDEAQYEARQEVADKVAAAVRAVED